MPDDPAREPAPVVLCNSSYLPDIGGIENWMAQVAARLVGACPVAVVTRQRLSSMPAEEVREGIAVLRYGPNPRAVPDRLAPVVDALRIVGATTRFAEGRRVVFNFFDPRPEHVYAAALLRLRGARVICSLGGTMSERASRWLKWLAARSAHAIVSMSAYAVRAFGQHHPRVHVCWPTGPLSTGFEARAASFEAQQVLTVCRVHPRKNLESLIEVAARLPDLAFVVAGDHDIHHDYHAALVARVEALGARNVRFVGEKVGESLHRLYGESTVFFLPSHHEMFGLAFAEATSFGLPIVAPRHTAIPEAVTDGSGILYQPGEVDEAVAAISMLTASPERWLAASAAAKAAAGSRLAEDWIGRYARLLLEAAGVSA